MTTDPINRHDTRTRTRTATASRRVLAGLLVVVGVVLSPLLLGFEPVGNDPDLLYRPYKSELVRALHAGRLPWWSDRFALGIPLVAESHVAALYPPNLLLYGALPVGVGAAYRLAMWLHGLALAAATFGYARTLGLTPWGGALAAVAVAIGGYAGAHAVHEPFVTALPYVPLCLMLAERWLAGGKPGWLAGLALAWGAQVTLGHFQIPVWTAALVTITAVVRGAQGRASWRRVGLVAAGLVWGAAVAAVQLGPTAELSRVAGFRRPPSALMGYACPPAHLAQWALPSLYQGRNNGPIPAKNTDYWGSLGTTPEEAGGHVGVTALVLACIGLVAGPRDRSLAPWRWLAPLGLVLATLSGWWPDAYGWFLAIPGLGWFRAPGRHQLLPAIGLALLAGRGLDRSIPERRFAIGLGLALAIGLAAAGWSWWWIAQRPELALAQGARTMPLRWQVAASAWGLALATIVGWRVGRIGPWAPIAAATLELTALYYDGPATWARAVDPGSSPVLRRLAAEPGAAEGLIAGRLQDLPVRLGLTAAYPVLGITAPPPNYLLERAADTPPALTPAPERRWQRRFGVAYGVWAADDPVAAPGVTTLLETPDPVLERLFPTALTADRRRLWRLVRYDAPAPPARVVTAARELPAWGPLYSRFSRSDDLDADTAWFLTDDVPPGLKRTRPAGLPLGPDQDAALDLGVPATAARVTAFDGRSATVEHDGGCVLILRRTAYPGWSARINGALDAVPLAPVNGGLQALVLKGRGPSRIDLIYRPTALSLWATITTLALIGALATLVASRLERLRSWHPAASPGGLRAASRPGPDPSAVLPG